MTATDPAYGYCGHCHAWWRLRADDTLRRHNSPNGTVVCPGSRTYPQPRQVADADTGASGGCL